MGALERLDDGIWVAARPLRKTFADLGARMTVVRLEGGGLWVCSPVRLDEETRAAVEALGPVRCIVAPNRFHHLFLDPWLRAYPEAERWAAPGLPAKRSDLDFTATLDDEPPPSWRGTLDQHHVGGMPAMDEVVFFHAASRTLVVTDLLFHKRSAQGLQKLFWRANGCYGRLAPSRVLRLLIRERHDLRLSVDRILEWDFDRVVVAHGDVLESGGREAVRAGFAWLRAGA
ncbi:MAG: DUF4336 domain-containing protein [Myxococcota bacterium]